MSDSTPYNWNHGRASLPLPFQSRTFTSNDSLLPPPPPISDSSLIQPYYTPSSSARPTFDLFQLPSQSATTRTLHSTTARPPLVGSKSYPSLKRPYFNSAENHAYAAEDGRDTYEPIVEEEEEEEASNKKTIKADHRLLSFARSDKYRTVLDQHGRTNTFEITAQLHGMFFLSEIATNSGDVIMVQPELTCYRRNLFQISGSVTGPSGPISTQSEFGVMEQIVAQELTVTAIESVDNAEIRLVVIPWKSLPSNTPQASTNREQQPISIPIFQGINNQDINADLTVQNIAWRRLQFRVATANNGRRRELQQHFVLRLTLTASLSDGSRVVLAENTTAPIVVRGRSPRNFAARKEGSLMKPTSSSQNTTSPQKRRISAPPQVIRLPKPSLIEPPSRLLKSEADYPPSPLLSSNEYSRYSSWDSMSADQSAVGTPTYPPPLSLLAGYGHISSPPSNTPSAGSPVSYTTSESARLPYYNSHPSSMPIRLPFHSSSSSADDNPRPSKSPRHHQTIESSTDFPGFEQRLNPSTSYSSDYKGYLPPIVLSPQKTWPSADRLDTLQPISMPPPPPSLQHYSFPHEEFHVKQESGHSDTNNYTWRQQ